MILRRYLTGSLIGPFLLGFGIITFLLTMDMLLDLLDLLISKGIEPWIVARLFFLALGWMVALSIPCGVLVAALMTFGRLSQDNEIIALRASGVHLMQVFAPALVLSVIVAVALTLFNNYILPDANYAYASLMQEINRRRPTAEIRDGVLINDFKGYNLWIGRLNDRTGAMQDILIVDDRTQPQSPRTILARSGTLTYHQDTNSLSLVLRDGEIHEADPASTQGEYRRLHFETQTMNIIDASGQWDDNSRHTRGNRELNIPAMRQEIVRYQKDLARQDSLVRATLRGLPVHDSEELERVDPDRSSATPAELVLAALSRVLSLGRHRPPPPKWTPDQRRALELAHAQTREAHYLQRKISELRVEIQKKFSIPFACIVFVLVGAPLGIMARRGGLAVAYISAIFFIFYYLCLVGGEQLADRLYLAPWLSMWLPNMVLGGMGVYLTVRVMVSGQPARSRRTGKAG